MKKHLSLLLAGSAVAVLALPPISARATGFRLPDQDATATSRGEAFAATADNASAIYYNPAGLTQLRGHNVRAGVYGIYMDVTYNGTHNNQKDLHAVPQLFYAYGSEKLPLALGLGIYSPYGLSSRWSEASGFRTLAIEGKVTYMRFNPVVAWQIVPALSIAAGPMVDYAELDLSQGVWQTTPGADLFRFKGDDVFAGYNVGLLWKIHPKLQFGATYRSATTGDLQGHTEGRGINPPPLLTPFQFHQNASARMPFPQNVVGGISWRPTPAWNLEFNVDWTDWRRLDTLTINQEAAVPPLFGQSIPKPLKWESSFYYEFGVTRKFAPHWAVSVGYIFNENSVPDKYYLPLVFDLDRHFGSVGASYENNRLSLALAYQFGYGPSRQVTSSVPSLTGQSADGTYAYTSHALLLTLGLGF